MPSWVANNLIQEVTMHKTLWTGTFAAIPIALIVGLAAQQPPSSSASQPSSERAANKVTISGCIQRSEQAPTGTTGAPSSMSESKFILTNAMPSSSSSTSSTGTSGMPSSSTSTASSYRLDADESKLSAHVGHKVEITGQVESASMSGSPSSGATGAGATGATSGSSSTSPKLKVDSVKMIAATCP